MKHGFDFDRRRRALVRALSVAFLSVSGCGSGAADPQLPRPALTVSGPAALLDASDELGLDFHHQVGSRDGYPMPQIMGSGAAFLDFDADGRLDILLIDGQLPDQDSPDVSAEPATACRLYRQQEDGTFLDVTRKSGLVNPGYGMGVAVGDINNDGYDDLYFTNYGPDRLFLNNGDGTFTDITEEAGITNVPWSTAATFVDIDQDGWLDLFVVNYVDYLPGSFCDDGSGRRDYCGPEAFAGTVDKLYRNLGGQLDGESVRFEDVTVSLGIVAYMGRGLGVLARDFNDDGLPDIYVANDMEPNFLWIQQPDGTFRNEAAPRGVASNRLGYPEASMGVAFGDLNENGHDDLVLTHLRGETNTFYAGSPGAIFDDRTAQTGLGPLSLVSTGFGIVAADLQHNGRLDLVVVNGRVKRGPPLPHADLDPFWNSYAEPNQILLNQGRGVFREADNVGASDFHQRVEVSRGLVMGDVDNDGDLDLLVTNCAGPARLYLNQFPKQGNWLMLRVRDPALRRDAIGARVVVHVGDRQFRREVQPSSSYLSSHDPRLHFGIGEAERYDEIIVNWPGPEPGEERFPGGPADRHLELVKGSGAPLPDGDQP